MFGHNSNDMIGRSIGYSPVSEFTSFFSKRPRNPSNYTLEHDSPYINTCPAGFVEDPEDSTKMILYRGEFTGATTVAARISAFTFPKTDPYTLTFDSFVLEPSESYDTNGCRFGWPMKVGSEVWYYYVGVDGSFDWRICLATSTDGRTFTKQGVVLDFNNTDEKSISGPSVYKEGNNWYMIYTGWDGLTSPPNNNPGQSVIGIKLATSSDGINWTRTETIVIPLGTDPEYDSARVEDGVLYKFDGRWVILYSCFGGPGTDHWSIQAAYNNNESPDSAFTKVTQPYFELKSGNWDAFLVACPFLYFHEGEWLLYYQGGNGVPETNAFNIGIARVI